MRKVLFLVSFLLAAGMAQAQTAKEALKAFAILESHTEMGVNFRDYTSNLGEVNYHFKAFLEGPEAAKYPGIKTNLGAALGAYAEAGAVWQAGMASGDGVIYSIELIRQLVNKFPSAGQGEFAGGATMSVGGLRVSKLLPLYWEQASRSIALAKQTKIK